MANNAKDWDLYLAGKRYNNSLKPVNGYNYYELVDILIDFFNGNQWRGMENNEIRKPVFNIIQKAIRYFVASLTSSNVKVNTEPLEYVEGMDTPEFNASEFATAEIGNLFEKFKMDNRIRDALFKSAITGDVAAHMYWDKNKKPYGGAFGDNKGEICFELVSGTNVFFGNANNKDKEIQPYIIISGRDLVENLKREANKSDQDQITPDNDYGFENNQSQDIEVEADGYGKATYIIVYKKDPETGTITVSKCVQNSYIYKDIDTGLSVYPIAWLPWEKQESTYHGKAACTEILETQIFINIMFAMMYIYQANNSFPKLVFNKDYIETWDNEIGVAIPVQGLGSDISIKNIAGYLDNGNMSNQLIEVIKMAFDYVKDILGINDAVLGNVNPENASGKSIIATVKQAGIPLENVRANEYEWIEDIVRILLDMMGTYYGERPIVLDIQGQKKLQNFDFSQLKNIWLNIKVDVGETSIYSDIARKQTLDNLFASGKIELIDYLERLDDKDIPDRKGLINKIQQNQLMAQQQAQAQAQTQMQAQQSQPQQSQQNIPPEVMAELQKLSPQQLKMVQQHMGI